jgi:DNA-directed RNA polymerase specialized sigma24 family protein
MAKPRYDTVREQPNPTTERIDSTFLYGVLRPFHLDEASRSQPDPDLMDEINRVIEETVSGRKYEVLLLRSQGKTVAEIALMLSISKNTVQGHYRRAVRQVRQALGLEPAPAQPGKIIMAASAPAD